MNYIALLLVLVFSAGTASGQLRINLEHDHLAASDTLWIDVRMSSDSDTLDVPVNSFQFVVSSTGNMAFIGSKSSFTLTQKSGWTTGEKADNGLVGGFSSSIDAINTIGVLIRLQFVLKGTDTSGTIELRDFKLNSGIPDHFPTTPSLQLDLRDHLE